MIGSYFEYERSDNPPVTPIFSLLSDKSTHFGQEQSLTPSQIDILQSYIDCYLNTTFQGFISAAPTYPVDLRPLHRYILSQAYSLKTEIFAALLTKFYPPASPEDATFEQNTQLRAFLLTFNRICNEQADVNQPLFACVFDNKLSPKKNSPVKRKLVADFFKARINPEFSAPDIMTNCFVKEAILSKESLLGENCGTSVSSTSVRRRLFFGYE
ncbi:MAG: hypothetical protein AB7I18_01380 [Candidatus Berkiella sp.]